jgi:TonB family protein
MRLAALALCAQVAAATASPPMIPEQEMPRFVSGDRDVRPRAEVIDAMTAADQTKIRGTFKMCLDVRGRVATVTTVRSTGYPSYDKAILRAVRNWRYVPYRLDGTPYAMCTTVTFLFAIQ